MGQNLNLRAWLVIGAIATTILLQSQTTHAQTVDANDLITKVETKPVQALERYQQGLTAVAAGNHAQAIVSFDRAIELAPRYLQAYIERGNAKEAIHDLSGALADFTKAIALDPKSAAAYYNRGTILSKSGNSKQAAADYTKAIDINPQYAAAYLNRGNNLDDLGNSAGAIARSRSNLITP
jgi:tetratricopeptide (TPR) repeat protein